MTPLTPLIEEAEKEFNELCSFYGSIKGRKDGVDYTEWKILQSKLSALKQADEVYQKKINTLFDDLNLIFPDDIYIEFDGRMIRRELNQLKQKHFGAMEK